jgi:FkbM family methyltransferase
MKFDLRIISLRCLRPFRQGVVAHRRGSLLRNICVAVLKHAQRAYRGRLAGLLKDVRPLDFPALRFASSDSMVIETIYWFGIHGYEGLVAAAWIEQCRSATAILEIGGNIGLFTVIGATASNARYTVVEPVPAVAAILRDNLRLNSVVHVELLEAAMIPADRPATVTLLVPHEQHDMPVGAHLTIGTEVALHAGTRQISVQGLPLRDYVAGRDLIKIDAEGIEVDLLRAVRDVLIAEKPNLLIEVLPSSPELAAFLVTLAKEAGYQLIILPEWGADRPVKVAPEDFTLAMMHQNNSKDLLLVQPR